MAAGNASSDRRGLQGGHRCLLRLASAAGAATATASASTIPDSRAHARSDSSANEHTRADVSASHVHAQLIALAECIAIEQYEHAHAGFTPTAGAFSRPDLDWGLLPES